MTNLEKKFAEWVQKNMWELAVIAGTAVSLLLRYTFRWLVSGDYVYFLEGWYYELQGGFSSLTHPVGNYNFLYQMCIALMTYIPIEPLFAYKILSVIFDYALAAALAAIVWQISGQNKKIRAVAAYLMVIFSPIVVLNSSGWAQCDSIYVFWIIFSLLLLLKEKYFLSLLLLGVAFSFKLQAVFILPFYLFVYFAGRKFSILHFLTVPLMMLLTNLPAVFFGRKITEIFSIYFGQTMSYKNVSLNYPAFWNLFYPEKSESFYIIQNPSAIIFTIVVLAALMAVLLMRRIKLDDRNMIYIAFLSAYTCVFFLPHMHERYSYIYEILAIAVLFLNKRTIFLMAPLYVISFVEYGSYLFALAKPPELYLAFANLAVWMGYTYLLLNEMLKDAHGKT